MPPIDDTTLQIKRLAVAQMSSGWADVQGKDGRMPETSERDARLIAMTVEIVAAHVAHNTVAVAELPAVIASIHAALVGLGKAESHSKAAVPRPAVSVRASVKPDYIICLEDGRKLKMLRRYLRTHYDLTPEQYRSKWNLPSDYPMVAPHYAERRRAMAKKIGLERKSKASSSLVAEAPVRKPRRPTKPGSQER